MKPILIFNTYMVFGQVGIGTTDVDPSVILRLFLMLWEYFTQVNLSNAGVTEVTINGILRLEINDVTSH